MAKFDEALINRTTLFNDGCKISNYHLKGLRPIDPTDSDNILPILRARYPRLTDQQHTERMLTALHEGAHLVVAMALGPHAVGPYAYIRVPGRQSAVFMHRGEGAVACGTGEPSDDIIISYAGVVWSEFITKELNIVNTCAGDEQDAQENLRAFLELCSILRGPVTLTDEEMLELECHYRDCATYYVMRYLPVIEKAAIAMLLTCDRNGDIDGKRWVKLRNYVRQLLIRQKAWYEYRDECIYQPDFGICEVLADRGMGNALYQPAYK